MFGLNHAASSSLNDAPHVMVGADHPEGLNGPPVDRDLEAAPLCEQELTPNLGHARASKPEDGLSLVGLEVED